MPAMLPSEPMRSALAAIGISPEKHERRTLRSLIHEKTGAPPPDHRTADELARMLLDIEKKERK